MEPNDRRRRLSKLRRDLDLGRLSLSVDRIKRVLDESSLARLRRLGMKDQKDAVHVATLQELLLLMDTSKYRRDLFDEEDYALALAGHVRVTYGWGGIGVLGDDISNRALNFAFVYDQQKDARMQNVRVRVMVIDPRKNKMIGNSPQEGYLLL